jgi:hypothetical protein
MLDAFTLTSDRRDARPVPSRRYMALLIEGAETHGLPASTSTWLRSCPAATRRRRRLQRGPFSTGPSKRNPDSRLSSHLARCPPVLRELSGFGGAWVPVG